MDEAKGVVVENTPNGDQVLMGEAANQEALARDPRGPVHAAQTARLLYRRLAQMFPTRPWRPKGLACGRHSLADPEDRRRVPVPRPNEKQAYMRRRTDDEEIKKIIKFYPGSRQAAMAAYALIDNKLCGDWQGDPKCPQKESENYEKYAGEYSDGPRTAQALYQAVYRQAVLVDMYERTETTRVRHPKAMHVTLAPG